MRKHVIAARSINGVVFWNGEGWTDDKTKALRYVRFERALQHVIYRFSTILYGIRAVAVVEKKAA